MYNDSDTTSDGMDHGFALSTAHMAGIILFTLLAGSALVCLYYINCKPSESDYTEIPDGVTVNEASVKDEEKAAPSSEGKRSLFGFRC